MPESVLLHACCAHCTAYTVEHWRRQGYQVTAFWYNPNIHPFTEHQNRLEAVRYLSQELALPLIIEAGYEMPLYFREVAGHEVDRCRHCFRLRLVRTAARAKIDGFARFTSTLLISPHQQHELIQEQGEQAAATSGVPFLYADLRKRYSDSRHITKPMDIYRQQYCGCVYSEWERYTSPGND